MFLTLPYLLRTLISFFNACNSSNVKCSQKMGHAISSNTGHITFLLAMFEYISNLKLNSKNSKVTLLCINGWKIRVRNIWIYHQLYVQSQIFDFWRTFLSQAGSRHGGVPTQPQHDRNWHNCACMTTTVYWLIFRVSCYLSSLKTIH